MSKFEITIKSGLPEIEGLEALAQEAEARSEAARKAAVSMQDAPKYDTMRRDNNAFIKDVRSKLDLAQKEWDDPLSALRERVEEAIAPLVDANKDLSRDILEAKKAAFRETVREYFMEEALPDANGELPDFDKVYEHSWYGSTRAAWQSLLDAKLRKIRESSEPERAIITIDADKATIRAIEERLIADRVHYEITKEDVRNG